MFGQAPLTPKEVATQFRIEFGAQSPKLRLSVMAYLIEHGVVPSDTLSTSAFTAMIDEIVVYITSDSDGFAAYIESLQPLDDGPVAVSNEGPGLVVTPQGGLDYL